jgi:hypothetical protein
MYGSESSSTTRFSPSREFVVPVEAGIRQVRFSAEREQGVWRRDEALGDLLRAVFLRDLLAFVGEGPFALEGLLGFARCFGDFVDLQVFEEVDP